ncbi:MAG: transcriptional regulator [Verrucomicrobiales bacterium VVV1]|nr:MAG: transcriptional regulator [Verrucomicrobiales bacterium VVV1]
MRALLSSFAAGLHLAGPAVAQLKLELATNSATPAAQPPPAPDSYAPLLRTATPSIVSVFPAILVGADNPDQALERFFTPPADEKKKDGKDKPIERLSGSGSGVIISKDGFIVTNRHVVILPSGKPADSFKIELSDRRQVPAKLVGMDTVTDLALLKIEAPDLTPIPLADSDTVKTGDLVFAIGNPFRIGITATMGMVSATKRSTGDSTETIESYIQTDAAINPGNSGGALINASGQLIGINTAIYGNSTNAGIGFAIPTRLVKYVVEKLAIHGKVARGFFGIQADNPPPSAEMTPQGATVTAIMPESPAADAKLAVGDLIQSVNSTSITDRQDLRLALSMIPPDDKTSLTIVRGGQSLTATLTPWEPKLSDGRMGFFSEDLLPDVVLAVMEKGIVVHSITKEASERTRLEEGMIITSINNAPASAMQDVSTHLRKGVNKITVLVGDGTRTLSVRIP